MLDFDRLVNNEDIPGLVAVLRYRADANLREIAAQALGKLDKTEAVEPLMRAYLEDPEESVQQAALSALYELIGAEANMALQAYRASGPDPEPWLQDGGLGRMLVNEDNPEFGDEMDNGPDTLEIEDPLQMGENEVHGLIGILAGERDAGMRIKAIRALARSGDARSIAALAQTALYSDDPQVRRAARQALERLYGDDTDKILNSFRPEEPDEELEEIEEEDVEPSGDDEFSEMEEDEFEEDDYEEEEEETSNQPAHQLPRLASAPVSDVMHEEGIPWRWLLAASIILVIIIVIVILFLK